MGNLINTDFISEEVLKQNGIKKIQIIAEKTNSPIMCIHMLDDTNTTIKGFNEIVEYLEKLKK